MKSQIPRALCMALCLMLLLCACVPRPSGEDGRPDASTETDSAGDASTEPETEPEPTPVPSPEPMPTPENLVAYQGDKLYHIFYHFLIAFPEIAYSNSYGRNLDNDSITPTEFRRSLEELYKNNFVLVDLNDYYEKGEDGNVRMVPIMVPEGKRPLVMSFDDINYYSKNLGLGICDKIIIDPATGKLAMSTMQDGKELITYDNDIVPMLEAFVEEFPDFAPFGTLGMLNLTGFDGILGYRTQRDSPNRESEIEAVRPIVQKLKDNGWYFASHSFGHPNMSKMSLEGWQKDLHRWQDEVAPLVGDTKIHVFAYGDYAGAGLFQGRFTDPRMRYMIDEMGFEVLCGVGRDPFFKAVGNALFCDRFNIDGFSLRKGHRAFEGMMDPNVVYYPPERDGRPITWTG